MTTQEKRILAGLTLAFAVLIFAALLLLGNTAQVRQATESLARALDLLERMDDLTDRLEIAESGRRAYVITGEEDHLAAYRANIEGAAALLESLRERTAESSHYSNLWSQAEGLTRRYTAVSAEAIRTFQESGLDGPSQREFTKEAERILTEFRQLLVQTVTEDRASLEEQRTLQYERVQGTEGFAVLVSLFALILFIPLMILFVRANRHRREVEQVLQRTNMELEERVRDRTARLQRTVEELEKADDFRTKIMESAVFGLGALDLEGRFTLANEQFGQIVGYAPEELLGKPYSMLLSPEDDAALRPQFVEAVRDKRPLSYREIDVIKKDGSVASVVFSWSPLLAQGEVRGVVGTVLDITELKRLDQALRESEERLRLIIEGALDAVITIDKDGAVTRWNPQAEKIFGWSREEAEGRRLAELIIPPRFREAHELGLKRFAETGEGRMVNKRIETTALTRDGREVPIELAITPIRTSSGVLFGAFVRDITERKQAVDALRESEARLRQLADAMPQIVWAARPDGFVDYYNERWYEFTGFPRGPFGEDSWTPILHPDDVQRCRDVWYAAVRTAVPYEIEYRFKDRIRGGYRWFMGRALPIRNERGEVIRWFGTCTDIDDQKRVTERLEQVVEERTVKLREIIGELEAFSYSISHDMRAPLRSMQGLSQILLEDHSDNLGEKGKDLLHRIQKASHRLDILIQDVLAYSRVSKSEHRLEPIDLDRFFPEIIQDYESLHQGGAVVSLEHPLLTVMGHEALLSQIISNLLGNAVKFVAPGVRPQVRVRSEIVGDKVKVWIEDNGIGIDPEHYDKIFTIFGRVHSEKEYQGTGIGLAIVKKAVERMGGEVGVASTLGAGSRFWFTLLKV